VDVLGTVKETIDWFAINNPPDLIFMDIQLSDGLSFHVFNQVPIRCPVIFTTAFEEYALRAFKVNSIDYLLKPINPEDLTYAIDQFESQKKLVIKEENQTLNYKVDRVLQALTKNYKTRFVVNVGTHIRLLEAEKIFYIFSMEKATFLREETGKTFDINYSLDQLETLVDPALFFRINRQFLISIKALQDIISYSGSILKVKLVHQKDNGVFISRKKLRSFKQWLDR
jgi:DNA-binding LytR/AlgR family response regulator